MAKEGSTVGGLMDVVGTCTSMALQYGVPLITLVDKFRHARFEPSGMTSNKDIPFAKSIIDYIFCWLGCRFMPGYAEKNIPNRSAAVAHAENDNTTTARTLVEKTKDLAHKIAEARAEAKVKPATVEKTISDFSDDDTEKQTHSLINRLSDAPLKVVPVPGQVVAEVIQPQIAVMQQFNAQFEHFQDDAPACDVCGSITVRNGTCYKCFNCGNSMGCS
jgi:ribonucleoside-diphosphate reductase alpha chain